MEQRGATNQRGVGRESQGKENAVPQHIGLPVVVPEPNPQLENFGRSPADAPCPKRVTPKESPAIRRKERQKMMWQLSKQPQPPRATKAPQETKTLVTPVKKAKPAKWGTPKTALLAKVPLAQK